MFKFFIYTLFLTACLTASCKKKCENTAVYEFYAQMFISPNSEKIKLGDTLLFQIKIMFQNVDQETGVPVNVQPSSISTSGVDFIMYRRAADSAVQLTGLENFNIVAVKGSCQIYNNASIRVSYLKGQDSFIFEALIIPKSKGLAKFGNYKAEGWMNGKCVLNIFQPVVGNFYNNNHLIRDFYGPGSDGFVPDNSYYVWVE